MKTALLVFPISELTVAASHHNLDEVTTLEVHEVKEGIYICSSIEAHLIIHRCAIPHLRSISMIFELSQVALWDSAIALLKRRDLDINPQDHSFPSELKKLCHCYFSRCHITCIHMWLRHPTTCFAKYPTHRFIFFDKDEERYEVRMGQGTLDSAQWFR